ncbi:sulfite exporter TauE/SafE family protein [Candidatus Woesearchaeota archaeon]|nr:sulfite exporter TauE/SafE family protein [Candidatus Woesearchaeota archaeon]
MVNYALASLAFSAGLVSFANPCGFALLPVYITYYFKNEGLEKTSLFRRISAGLMFGLMVSLGFAAVFSLIGIIVAYVGRGLLKYVGWFDLSIGILLIVIGFIYLFNLDAKIHFKRLTNFGEKLKSNKLKNKYASFFLYGMGFAIASLGCTLPIFLLVVTAASKAGGILNGIAIFLTYAAGMSFFMILFSLAVALSKTAMEKLLKRWMPYIYKFGAVIVILAGVYLIYNQVVLGRLFA